MSPRLRIFMLSGCLHGGMTLPLKNRWATPLQSCNLAPGHFHRTGQPSEIMAIRLGNSLLARNIDTFRNVTHYNGPMGSFGQTESSAIWPVFLTHPPESPIGFVSQKRSLASSGESSPGQSINTFRNSTHHNGPMGSFGQTVSWAIRPVFSTHYAETAVGFVSQKRSLASFGESSPGQSIDTYRNSTYHSGSMGSFGQTVSWAIWPVFSTHHAETPIGFVSSHGRWVRLGKARPAGASMAFGAQHI